MLVLDTDFIINLLSDDPSLDKTLKKLVSLNEPIFTTIFNVQEVLFGYLLKDSPENYKIARDSLYTFRILNYDFKAMQIAIEIKRTLKLKGTPIGILDEMIASVCLANNAKIVTNNVKHFSRVEGLEIVKI